MSAAKPKDHKDNKEKERPEDERPWDQPQPPAQPFNPDPQQPETKPVPPSETKPGPPKDEPLVKASDPPFDPFQPVDYFGNPINVGDLIDVYSARVIGIRADDNNRLNIWAVPELNAIKTIDPNNPLNGQLDGKAFLISGYSCLAYPPGTTFDQTNAPQQYKDAIKVILDKIKDGTAESNLPSNFLVPSLL